MKLRLAVVLTVVASFFPVIVFAGTCGPFGMFEGSDYCVTCANQVGHKVYNCPGGETGKVAVGVQNKGCVVEYYHDGCGKAAADRASDSRTATTAASTHASPGKAVVSMDGDEVVVRMTLEDFQKLMTLTEPRASQ